MLVVSEGGSLFHMDLSMVADGNSAIEHNLPQSGLYDDVVQFWSQTNVAYTPTLGVTFGGLSGEDYWYMKVQCLGTSDTVALRTATHPAAASCQARNGARCGFLPCDKRVDRKITVRQWRHC